MTLILRKLVLLKLDRWFLVRSTAWLNRPLDSATISPLRLSHIARRNFQARGMEPLNAVPIGDKITAFVCRRRRRHSRVCQPFRLISGTFIRWQAVCPLHIVRPRMLHL